MSFAGLWRRTSALGVAGAEEEARDGKSVSKPRLRGDRDRRRRCLLRAMRSAAVGATAAYRDGAVALPAMGAAARAIEPDIVPARRVDIDRDARGGRRCRRLLPSGIEQPSGRGPSGVHTRARGARGAPRRSPRHPIGARRGACRRTRRRGGAEPSDQTRMALVRPLPQPAGRRSPPGRPRWRGRSLHPTDRRDADHRATRRGPVRLGWRRTTQRPRVATRITSV